MKRWRKRRRVVSILSITSLLLLKQWPFGYVPYWLVYISTNLGNLSKPLSPVLISMTQRLITV